MLSKKINQVCAHLEDAVNSGTLTDNCVRSMTGEMKSIEELVFAMDQSAEVAFPEDNSAKSIHEQVEQARKELEQMTTLDSFSAEAAYGIIEKLMCAEVDAISLEANSEINA